MKFFNIALLAASAFALKQDDASHDGTMHQCWEEEEKKEDWHPKEGTTSDFKECFNSFYKDLWKMVDWDEDKMLDRGEFESLLWIMIADWGMPEQDMDGAMEWFDDEMQGEVTKKAARRALKQELKDQGVNDDDMCWAAEAITCYSLDYGMASEEEMKFCDMVWQMIHENHQDMHDDHHDDYHNDGPVGDNIGLSCAILHHQDGHEGGPIGFADLDCHVMHHHSDDHHYDDHHHDDHHYDDHHDMPPMDDHHHDMPPMDPNMPPMDPNMPPMDPNMPPMDPAMPPMDPNMPPMDPPMPAY